MIEFGQVMQDKITGFVGCVMARTVYATGCVSYGLNPIKLDKDGDYPETEWLWFDEIKLQKTKIKRRLAPRVPSGDIADFEDLDAGPQCARR